MATSLNEHDQNGRGGASGYGIACIALLLGIGLVLLAMVDVRRGFLFAQAEGVWQYKWRSPYAVFGYGQVVLGALGFTIAVGSFASLRRQERRTASQLNRRMVGVAAAILLALLVIDLFVYRGVAAERAIEARKLSAGWLDGFGWQGAWKPLGVAAAYGLTVWHATLLGLLLSGLAMVYLPLPLERFAARRGLTGGLWGTVFAVPQPFCSCCAAAWAPTLQRRGVSAEFLLAFVVAAPMVNVTTLVLAGVLLPAPFSALRIASGLFLPAVLAYAVVKLSGTSLSSRQPKPESCTPLEPGNRFVSTAAAHAPASPTELVAKWLWASGKLAAWFVPVMLAVSALAAWIFDVLPIGCSNDIWSVLVAAIGGTLLMVSTWSEIPLAHQLIASGCYAPAATLLVVLPPVSLPCLAILTGCTRQVRSSILLGIGVMLVGVAVGVAYM